MEDRVVVTLPPFIRYHPYQIRTHPSDCNLTFITTSQALSPNTVTFKVRSLAYALGEDINIQSIRNTVPYLDY
jgi:hypothetical protein